MLNKNEKEYLNNVLLMKWMNDYNAMNEYKQMTLEQPEQVEKQVLYMQEQLNAITTIREKIKGEIK